MPTQSVGPRKWASLTHNSCRVIPVRAQNGRRREEGTHRADVVQFHVVEKAVGGENDDVTGSDRKRRVDGVSGRFEIRVILEKAIDFF